MILPDLPAVAGLTPDKVATLVNALKSYPQFIAYINDLLSGVCPFCDPLGPKNKPFKIAGEGTRYAWRVWHNPYPIQGKDAGGKRIVSADTHLVIAPVRHISNPNEMTLDDWNNWSALVRHATTRDGGDGMDLPGGGVVMRFGKPELNAGSILHIHTNIIVPNLLAEVRPPLAKSPVEMALDYKILAVFAKMYAGMKLEELAPEEKVLVQDRMAA